MMTADQKSVQSISIESTEAVKLEAVKLYFSKK